MKKGITHNNKEKKITKQNKSWRRPIVHINNDWEIRSLLTIGDEFRCSGKVVPSPRIIYIHCFKRCRCLNILVYICLISGISGREGNQNIQTPFERTNYNIISSKCTLKFVWYTSCICFHSLTNAVKKNYQAYCTINGKLFI